MRIVAIAPLFLAAGCYTVTHRPGCEDTPTDVADDEVTDLGTAADLLAPVPPESTVAGHTGPGDAVDVTVTIARGDGSAQWVDSENVDVESRGPGLIKTSDEHLDIDVQCFDSLEVPVDVTISAPDAGIAWSVTTPLRMTDPDGLRDVWHTEDFDGSGLPVPPTVDPSEWEATTATLTFRYEAGELHGTVYWNGERTLDDDSAQSASREILTW